MKNTQKYNSFVGIGVSKKKLDTYNSQTDEFTIVKNNRAGIRNFCKTLKPQDDLLVVSDLTGGYEQLCVDIFYEFGFNIHRAEGRRVKAFLKSYGQFAKTDKMDAKALTFFGEKLQEILFLYTPKNDQVLSYLEHLADITSLVTQAKNRLQAPKTPLRIQKMLQEHIDLLKEQEKTLEAEVENIIMNDDEMKQKYDILTSFKGIGKKIAFILIGMLPELGQLNRRQIAAIAGVASYARDSGASFGYRFARHGRPKVKKALFMAALVGIRHNTRIKEFYNHLINDNKKKKMVAIVACMRKIAITLTYKNFLAT